MIINFKKILSSLLVLSFTIIMYLPSTVIADNTKLTTELYLVGFNSSELTEELVNNAEVTEEMIQIALNNKEYITENNEYDTLITIKQNLRTKRTLEENLNSTIEGAILERSSLPKETLSKIGYTNSQIKILKEYDGSPIEDNPQLRSVAGSITSSFQLIKRSSVQPSGIGLSFSGSGVSGSFSLNFGYRLIMNRHMAIGQTGNAKYIGNNY